MLSGGFIGQKGGIPFLSDQFPDPSPEVYANENSFLILMMYIKAALDAANIKIKAMDENALEYPMLSIQGWLMKGEINCPRKIPVVRNPAC
ncbi:hypothetical protein ACJJIW_10240 [Microbulbifer sp. JMSA004]|uniref:hypothetical protein n=1 Tax=unclassified Microbulbifer TaxID=2619833 RepID=UPI0024ADE54C|nr:hypothetical protein [Microbulbifer sp. VAAF005]WHI45655.1 hypothetical protein P0078_18270 [Microbulbifer sp. VAAF005]